jgi:hypothetical protein
VREDAVFLNLKLNKGHLGHFPNFSTWSDGLGSRKGQSRADFCLSSAVSVDHLRCALVMPNI